MSAWVSPVCGRAYTMLSIFTASTRFSECTGSPVNGDRSCGEACEGAGAAAAAGRGGVVRAQPLNTSTAPVARPTRVTTAAAAFVVLRRVHIIAPSGPRLGAHLTRNTQPHLLPTILPGIKHIQPGIRRIQPAINGQTLRRPPPDQGRPAGH